MTRDRFQNHYLSLISGNVTRIRKAVKDCRAAVYIRLLSAPWNFNMGYVFKVTVNRWDKRREEEASVEQLAEILRKVFASAERKRFLESLEQPVNVKNPESNSRPCELCIQLILKGEMRRYCGSSTGYWRCRDALMAEVVLSCGCNRGETLRKLTLSVTPLSSSRY